VFASTVLLGILAGSGSMVIQAQVAAPRPATEVIGLSYTNAFFADADYDPAIPSPESLLGFPLGQRAATAAEVNRCLAAWAAAATNRTLLVEYARTHEGRPLSYLVITSARNRARLDDIQKGLARLGDPRQLSEADANRLVDSLPPIAWLGYCIHGDETEGSDAALAVIHHLLADQRADTTKLVDDLVIIVDPLQNADGRDRFLKMIAEHRGANPNIDQQSLLHEGYWPYGRGNHYLFDMNRDWIFATQPETRGRLREVMRWNPQIFVDIHGMSGEETYLFAPSREPINRHVPANRSEWGRVFARDQARAFDAHGWVYYTGEWNENWYPGYSDSWSVYRGAVGLLYEVASIGQDGVRQADGRIQSQRESIHQHIVSTMANLATMQTHGKTRLKEFAAERRANVSSDGPYAHRTWAILPSDNRTRLASFVETLRVQGIEVHQLTNEFTAPVAVDQLGRSITNRVLPVGTILVANRQPTAPLVATILEFDPHIADVALEDERREVLRNGGTRIYDITSWNLTMMSGVEAFTLPQDLPSGARLITELSRATNALVVINPVAWIIDGADDGSVGMAARLMERGVVVRVAEKPFKLDESSFARGSVVITRLDNRRFSGELSNVVQQTAIELKLTVIPVGTGLGEDDLPDLGGQYFHRLEPPRIAVVGRGRISSSDFGSIWFLLDQQLGIRHSHLTDGDRPPEFARYNVIVIPDRGGELPPAWREPLKEWVKTGGTLIALGSAAADLASRTNELTQVRPLQEVLGRLADFEQMIFREWLAQTGPLPPLTQVWTNTVIRGAKLPWPPQPDSPKEEELKKRDAWNRLFMPQGALLASRVDQKHWLTLGGGELLPVLVNSSSVLMSDGGVETPVRFGVFTAAAPPPPEPEAKEPADEAKKKEAKPEVLRTGWSAMPEGYDLQLRMSGLLWPEAAQRLANSAVVTREGLGRGQVILFAGTPNFRASTRGHARLLANAIIYGPGFGAAATVRP
jgi:hypothetical protein